MKLKRSIIAVLSGVAAVVALYAAPVTAHDYKVVNGAINESLTGVAGDPANGRKVVIHRKKGNCLACHQMPIPEQQFHGEIAPPLHHVGSTYTEGEIRARVTDMKLINPDSFMPSFHRNKANHGGKPLHRVLKKFKNKTILSAQEVEDIVAYLVTLK